MNWKINPTDRKSSSGPAARSFIAGFILLAGFWLFSPEGSAFEDDWMRSGDEEISQSPEEQEKPREVWVVIENEAVIDAPIGRVAEFIQDVNKSVAMTPGLRNKVVLKQISDTERIDFDHYHLAWPFKDRYLIYHARQEYDKGDEILMTLNSIEDYPYEDGGMIRGTIRDSSFLLKALPEDPPRTRVQVKMRVLPGGWLPTWFLNTQTKNWSRQLLRNLQNQIRAERTRETRSAPDFCCMITKIFHDQDL